LVLLSVACLVVVYLLSGGSAFAQQSRSHGPAAGGGGPKQGGMMQMMPGMMGMMPQMMQMMSGMMGGMGPRMGAPSMMQGMGGMMGMMNSLHAWIGRFMAKKEFLGLSPTQVVQVEKGVFQHLKETVLNRARARALRLELQLALRGSTVELQAVEDILKKIAELDVQLQLGGIRLYTEILGLLTDEQRAKVRKLIGRPFPPPWEVMTMSPGMKMKAGAQKGGEEPAPPQPPGGEVEPQGHHPDKK
jgi:hypothetical protein